MNPDDEDFEEYWEWDEEWPDDWDLEPENDYDEP